MREIPLAGAVVPWLGIYYTVFCATVARDIPASQVDEQGCSDATQKHHLLNFML